MLLVSFVLAGCQSTVDKSTVDKSTESKNSAKQQSNNANQVLNYQQSDADYFALVERLQAGKATQQDINNILHVYPLTSFYEPSNSQEQASKLLSQNYMENQQWRECLATNNKLLALNYTSLTGHYGAAICATEMGNLSLGKFHNGILDGFIEAIWRSGDGKTPQTPLFITSINDLYAFVQLHQMVATGQSLEYVNDLPIQAIKVLNPETKRQTVWYFDMTSQFRRALINELEEQP